MVITSEQLTVIVIALAWVLTIERRLMNQRASIARLVKAVQEMNDGVEPLLLALGYLKTSKGWIAKPLHREDA